MSALETSKLFSGFPAQEFQALAQSARIKEFAQRQVIFQAGEIGDGVYVIGTGEVEISATVGPTERCALSRLGAGEFFGEMAVLDNEPRSATVTAVTDCTLFFIPREALLQTLERSPKLAVRLLQIFSSRMREFNRHYVEEVLQAERLGLVGRFARSIVHDFKNPLAIISFAADMIAAENATPESRKVTHLRLRKQVDRLSNMINELLEFTRGSQVAAILASTDYAALVNEWLEDIRPELSHKSIELTCENPPPSLRLLLDPRRLGHAFSNLVHNAVDAMPDGGKIILRFFVKNRQVITEIEDSGKGIAPEIAARLFEPFATYGKSHGTGLGLCICKRIIEDHRGTIQARNEPGRGAIFSFLLPLAH